MRPLFAGLASYALFTSPVFAQDAASPSPLDGITPEMARRLPPGELAERAFRQVAAQMQTVTRPYSRPGDPDPYLPELVFATAPRWAGDRGQCMATVVHIGQLRPPDEFLAQPGIIATEIVYKVIGDVDADDGQTLAEDEQERVCTHAGPVILADARDETQPGFFHLSGARIPTLPLIALQRVIRGAAAGTYTDMACDPHNPETAAQACRDPRALLAGLDLARLTELHVSRPGQRETHIGSKRCSGPRPAQSGG
jgi:hypothetical protein